jgi:DNA-directed RNA polymerase specialized sigma24 family protein
MLNLLCALATVPVRQREAWTDYRVAHRTMDVTAADMGITRARIGQLVRKADRRIEAALGVAPVGRA